MILKHNAVPKYDILLNRQSKRPKANGLPFSEELEAQRLPTQFLEFHRNYDNPA
ncbi:hypothetical protein LEP1GSC016_0793 [Leptospira borgpetersenii serovar Hardjo-bovis str. Sponselee]|uniref:Uncharacterized protein n=1 Tax=Leptospira borgpetersenii serovar Hardjo-bovis str. Sponselee TaxID=1303729 RepID=M6C7S8_LEPBO|nr:hypothetical protein LEP1GSC016_0793 [Leptospira borgpetersenii serovar Hardjo-bovis str. Sponselee]